MVTNLRVLGKFLDTQILLGERSGTFRDSAGMVWYNMVRYGMVWYGIIRYGKVQCPSLPPSSGRPGRSNVFQDVVQDPKELV